jgi:hypothetical protein
MRILPNYGREDGPVFRRRSRFKSTLMIATVIVSIPFAIEFALVHYAKWRSMLGAAPIRVETPCSDAAAGLILDAYHDCSNSVSGHLRNTPWKASNVLAAAAVTAVAGCWMMKKG